MASPLHHDVGSDAEGEGIDDEGAAVFLSIGICHPAVIKRFAPVVTPQELASEIESLL